MKATKRLCTWSLIGLRRDHIKLSFRQSREQSTYVAIDQEVKRKDDLYQKPLAAEESQPHCLERLPTSSLLRNIFLGTFFTSPILSKPGFAILRTIANSRSPFLNPDVNPLFRALIRPLIYDQFCAGRNRKEVCRTRDTNKKVGYSGVILCYGREGVVDKSNELNTGSSAKAGQNADIAQWKQGTLDTLDLTASGDWLGIKYYSHCTR